MYANASFARSIHGTHYVVDVTLSDWRKTNPDDLRESEIRVTMSWKSGFGGGSRNTVLRSFTDDLANLVFLAAQGVTPRWALADPLLEAGIDEGMVNIVRGF